MEFAMTNVVDNFTYQPFIDFINNPSLGNKSKGPILNIRDSDPMVWIKLFRWIDSGANTIYVLDFYIDSRRFARVTFNPIKFYEVDGVMANREVFLNKINKVSEEYPNLMEFFIWNKI